MNPLALGLPLALPSLTAATRVASGGLEFLQSLLTPTSPASSTSATSGSKLTDLQRSIAQEVRRGGFHAGLPLEIAPGAEGRLAIVSSSPYRQAIEQRLNANPYIVQQFREMASQAGAMFRLMIPAISGLDASV